MRHLAYLCPLAAFAAMLTTTPGFAQQPPGFGRPNTPTLSPYFNLLNPGADQAFNYYQLYRPQQRALQADRDLRQSLYQSNQQVERQIGQLGEDIEQIAERVRPGATLGTTGHSTSFLNQGRFFPGGGAGRR